MQIHCCCELQEVQKNYTRTAKELNKTRGNYSEMEAMVGKLRSTLENTASSQGKDRNRIHDLSEEVGYIFILFELYLLLFPAL